MKFFNSIRASMLLGKGHKLLQNGRYEEALERALKASSLKLDSMNSSSGCAIPSRENPAITSGIGKMP
jgi:hypothetical protein